MQIQNPGEITHPTVLVGSEQGCRIFEDFCEKDIELAGRRIGALASNADGSCLAVVDEHQVWRRNLQGSWTAVTDVGFVVQSICAVHDGLIVGGADEAVVARINADGSFERLSGFDSMQGRDSWFAGGPPLGVRSLAVNSEGTVLLAGVHVGGIPRSADGGKTWTPTIPIAFDVHEVRWHPSLPNVAVAATAVGLCVSSDAGLTWRVVKDGPAAANSLALGVLPNEVLVGFSEGPFASKSQLWRWRIGGDRLEQVREGLPEWLDGKIDTGWIATGKGAAAVLDSSGRLWISVSGCSGWKSIASDIDYSFGIRIV